MASDFCEHRANTYDCTDARPLYKFYFKKGIIYISGLLVEIDLYTIESKLLPTVHFAQIRVVLFDLGPFNFPFALFSDSVTIYLVSVIYILSLYNDGQNEAMDCARTVSAAQIS